MSHNRVRTFNKHITNPLLHGFASCSRGPFAVIGHGGRRSGKPYETTIMIWPLGEDLVMFKPDKEAVHGCSENAHFHDPGSGDGGRHRPLAPLAIVGRGESHPITLADWSAPSAAGSGTLLLVCRGVHLHWQRNAGAH